MPNIITRRSFLSNAGRAAVGLGLASLTTLPPFLRRALAEGAVGVNGKKLLFIFLRGGNDGVNNILPIMDPSYLGTRPGIGIPKHPAGDNFYLNTGGPATVLGVDPLAPGAALSLNNGFAGLNPAMADLVPLYNAGDLALVHRAGYRSLSRSHFDSEQYWEKGTDGTTANRLVTDGIWYRTIIESGWNQTHALSGVSIQSNMPASMRGEQPMTNLSSISRYNTLGVHSASGSTNTDRVKKDNRPLVHTLGTQFRDTLDLFQDPLFASNAFFDTNGTTSLFPINAASDQRGLGSGAYGFMQQIKSCAQILANTDAVICGTQMDNFDTHTGQVTPGSPHLGGHASLLRRLSWAYHALWRFFSNPAYNIQGRSLWDDTIIVTMSEFGRTSEENDSMGTDHAEASVMYIGGGGVNGGVYGCDINPNPKLGGGLNWTIGNGLKTGSLYSADTNVGYLRRTIDYRSVLGEIIRDHLGATQNQLNRIIPAYANESTEHLLNGGLVQTTPIIGELGIV
jgi:uncharacterized protein (DUF1501 family)